MEWLLPMIARSKWYEGWKRQKEKVGLNRQKGITIGILSAKKEEQIYWENKRRELWNAKEENFRLLWNEDADKLKVIKEDYSLIELQLKALEKFLKLNHKDLWFIIALYKDEKLEENRLEQWKSLELFLRALGKALDVYKQQEKKLKL